MDGKKVTSASVRFSILALALLCAPVRALTIQPALADLQGERTLALGNWTLGWSFRLTRDATIDALGLFSGDPAGVRGSYRLALWSSSRSLLSFTTITGLGDGRVGRFVWKALATPLALASGEYVVSASGNFLTHRDPYAFDPTTFTLADGVDYGRNRFRPSGSLVYPEEVQPGPGGQRLIGFFGANFSLASPEPPPDPPPSSRDLSLPPSPALQPVPSPLPLLGASAACLASRRLRQRRVQRARLG